MRALPDVTLVCIDTANHALALRALAQSTAGLRFARAVLLTDAVPAGIAVAPGDRRRAHRHARIRATTTRASC